MVVARSRKAAATAAAAAADEPGIVVTARQSRFHELDDSSLKDIDINDLSITIGKREILSHTRLVLKSGVRYVFVGRNGLGKSTVLKALADRKVPGIAPNVRMLLLDQNFIESSVKANSSGGTSVLKYVTSNDKHRQRLLDDAAVLSEILQDGSKEPIEVARIFRRLKLEEAERDLKAANLVAQHRSGARGSEARQIQIAREADLESATQALEITDSADVSKDVTAAVAMLETLHLNLEAMGSSTIEARARTALVGLGFSAEQIVGPMTELSGGWQTRAALAAALIQQTDILMLDEPTNFLDLPAVIWLQHFLTNELSTETTLLVTTHDRDFADAIAERLLILRINPALTLETFNSTLSEYYSEMRKQIKRMTKMSQALEKQKDHMQATIQKSVASAKKSGDDKKLKLAASRKKKLEERTGLQVSAKGGRFKLNRDLGGYHLTARADIEVPEFDPPVSMVFTETPPKLRNSGTLVSMENVSFTYKRAKKPTLNDINLTIHPGSRTGLVGLNGSGKSTLINLILSDVSSTGQMTGTLHRHPQARIAHYTQHETTRLLKIGQDDPKLTALTYLSKLYPDATEQSLRVVLSGLSLGSQAQANVPLANLSGGQLVRVALAECLLPFPPHLLILDEPTTHLDADSILALIEALKTYEGAIIVVSHDRFLMRCVVEGQSIKQATEDEEDASSSEEEDVVTGTVYRITRTSGKIMALANGVEDYEDFVVRQLAKQCIEI